MHFITKTWKPYAATKLNLLPDILKRLKPNRRTLSLSIQSYSINLSFSLKYETKPPSRQQSRAIKPSVIRQDGGPRHRTTKWRPHGTTKWRPATERSPHLWQGDTCGRHACEDGRSQHRNLMSVAVRSRWIPGPGPETE